MTTQEVSAAESGAANEMVAWLRGVLDEDERTAKAATPGPWFVHDTHLDRGGHTATVLSGEIGHGELRAWLPTMRSDVPWDDERNVWDDAKHIARQDPSHVLGIVAAHRRLLDLADRLMADATDLAAKGDGSEWVTLSSTARSIRRTLVAGYATREGYRSEWATQ